MITKDKKAGNQIQMVSIEQLVPQDHLLRKIDKAIDFSFIYDLVEDRYSASTGRPSIDPVVLIKIVLIQFLYGIRSMRQTIREIEVNVAYRWFLGLDFYDTVPHFSTFGKNYKRRFEGTDLFEQIFEQILLQCMQYDVISTDEIFVDATHVKAAANRKKAKKVLVAKNTAKFYDEMLIEEINQDREEHGKKPFEDDDSSDGPSQAEDLQGSEYDGNEEIPKGMKTQKRSATDPDSGWFHKGEHKEVFAYSVQAGCDSNGWILAYSVHPGNEHDSTTFITLYDKLKKLNPKYIVADAGYKTPAIAKMLIDDGITPVFPYTNRNRNKDKEMFRRKEFVYDEMYDCYLCPENSVLKYSTTTRNGYRQYKSDCRQCESCPMLERCTKSRNHQRIIERHIWEDYIETCEDIRHTNGMRELYAHRKETIERCFGTAKEYHGMRYTQEVGKAKMRMKVGLTFACMNIKKLVRLLDSRGFFREDLLSNIMNRFRNAACYA